MGEPSPSPSTVNGAGVQEQATPKNNARVPLLTPQPSPSFSPAGSDTGLTADFHRMQVSSPLPPCTPPGKKKRCYDDTSPNQDDSQVSSRPEVTPKAPRKRARRHASPSTMSDCDELPRISNFNEKMKASTCSTENPSDRA